MIDRVLNRTVGIRNTSITAGDVSGLPNFANARFGEPYSNAFFKRQRLCRHRDPDL